MIYDPETSRNFRCIGKSIGKYVSKNMVHGNKGWLKLSKTWHVLHPMDKNIKLRFSPNNL